MLSTKHSALFLFFRRVIKGDFFKKGKEAHGKEALRDLSSDGSLLTNGRVREQGNKEVISMPDRSS